MRKLARLLSILVVLGVAVSAAWVIANKTPEDVLDAEVTKIEKLADDVLLDPQYRAVTTPLPNGMNVGNLLLEINGPKDRVVSLASKNLDGLIQSIDQLRQKISAASDDRVMTALSLGKLEMQVLEAPDAPEEDEKKDGVADTQKPQPLAANLVLIQYSKIIKRYLKLQSRLHFNYVRNAHQRTGHEHEYSPDVYEKLNLSLNPQYYPFLMLKDKYAKNNGLDPDKILFNFRQDEASDDLTIPVRHIVGMTQYDKTDLESVALLEVPSSATEVSADRYAKAIQFLAIRERITNHWAIHRMVRSFKKSFFETDDLLLGKGPKNLLSFRESKLDQRQTVSDFHRDLWKQDHYDDYAALRPLLAQSAVLLGQGVTAEQIADFRYEFVKSLGGARPATLPKGELEYLDQLASQIDTVFINTAESMLQTAQLPGDDFSPVSVARRVTRARLLFIKSVLINDAAEEINRQGLGARAGHELAQKLELFSQTKLAPYLNKVRPAIYASVYKTLLSKEAEEVFAKNKRTRLHNAFSSTTKHIESGARAIHALKVNKIQYPSDLDPAELHLFEGTLIRTPAKGRFADSLAPTSVSQLRQFYHAKLRALSVDVARNKNISKIAITFQQDARIVHAMQEFFTNLDQAMAQVSQNTVPQPKGVSLTIEQQSPLSLVVLGVASASVKNLINDLVRSRERAQLAEINSVRRGSANHIAIQDQVKIPYKIEHLKPFGAAKDTNEESRIVDLYIQAMSILNLGEFVQSRITDKGLSKKRQVTNTPYFVEQRLNRISPEKIDYTKVDFAQEHGFNPMRALDVRAVINRQLIKSLLDQRLLARIMIEEALSAAPVLAQRSSDDELSSDEIDSDQALIKNTILEKMASFYQPASQFVMKTKFDKNKKTEISISKGSNTGALDQNAAFKLFAKSVYSASTKLKLQVQEAVQAQPFAKTDGTVGLGVFGKNARGFTKTDERFRKIFHTIPGVRRVLGSQDRRFAAMDELFVKATRTKAQYWLDEKFNPVLDAMAPIFLIMLAMIPLMMIIYLPIITAGVSGVIAAGGTAGIVQAFGAAASTATPFFATQMAAVSGYMSSLGLMSVFGNKALLIKAGFGLVSEYLLQYLFFGQLALMYHVNYIQLPHQLQYQMTVSQSLVGKFGIEPPMGAGDVRDGYKAMTDGKTQTIHSAVMLGVFAPMIAVNMVSRTKNFFGTKSRGAVNKLSVNSDADKTVKDITTDNYGTYVKNEGFLRGTKSYAKDWYQSQRDLGLKTALKPGVTPEKVSPILRPILDEYVVTTKKYEELITAAKNLYLERAKKYLKLSQELAEKPVNKSFDEITKDWLSQLAFKKYVNSKDINMLKRNRAGTPFMPPREGDAVSWYVELYHAPRPVAEGRELRSLFYQELAEQNFMKYNTTDGLLAQLHEVMSLELERASSFSGFIKPEELAFVRVILEDVLKAQSKTMLGREFFAFSSAPEALRAKLKSFDYLVMEALQNDMKRFPEKYLPKKIENYYEILGVSNVADTAEIKSKYRELSKIYHPDMNPDPTAAEKFMKIKEAYEVLSNPLKRSAFDETLKK